MKRIRIVPPVYLLAVIIGMVTLRYVASVYRIIPSPWNWLGVVPLAAGLLFGLSAVRLFRRYQTTIRPGQQSTHLLTAGPFGLSRNPIYVGMTLMLIGIAWMLGCVTPFLLIPIFVWLIAHNIIPLEEEMMADVFGEEYRQYQSRVRRWL